LAILRLVFSPRDGFGLGLGIGDGDGDSGKAGDSVLVIQLKNMATTSVPDSNEKSSHKNN